MSNIHEIAKFTISFTVVQYNFQFLKSYLQLSYPDAKLSNFIILDVRYFDYSFFMLNF